jgi:hypothetical protein
MSSKEFIAKLAERLLMLGLAKKVEFYVSINNDIFLSGICFEN